MNEQQQLQELAGALMRDCSAATLTALRNALSGAHADTSGRASVGLRVAVETALEMRQDAEAQQQAGPLTLSDALTRDRAAGRR